MKLACALTLSLAITACVSGCATTNDAAYTANLCREYNPNDGDLIGVGGPGDSNSFGGPGIDVAFLSGRRSESIIIRNGEQIVVIGPGGVDAFARSIELIVFDDRVLNLFAIASQPDTSPARILQRIPVWPVDRTRLAELGIQAGREALLEPCR